MLKYSGAPSKDAQELLETRLQKIAADVGYKTASSILTSYTDIEKEIAIRWLGEGNISVCDIQDSFPDFYCYLQNSVLPIDSQTWLEDYIEKYKRAKFANKYDQDIEDVLRVHSINELNFNKWYQDFKTVRTILADRSDIDVFYWIDGLGIDWIPVISSILEREKANGIHLNELIIGKALLPTTTSKNKVDLEKLVPYNLTKIGDLDNLAHKTNNKYPGYIIEEFDAIKKTIHTIIDAYACLLYTSSLLRPVPKRLSKIFIICSPCIPAQPIWQPITLERQVLHREAFSSLSVPTLKSASSLTMRMYMPMIV